MSQLLPSRLGPPRAWHNNATKERVAFALKWVASIVQIGGYKATSFGWTPLNLYLFLGGVLGWLMVGALWNDKAILLIHAVALLAMGAGLAGA